MLRTRSPFLRQIRIPRRYPSKWHQRFAQTAASPTPAPPKRRRFRSSYMWYGLVLTTSAYLGYMVRNFASPPPLPLPGTQEDELELQALSADIDALPVVKSMRAQTYHLHSDTPLPEAGKVAAHVGWVELDIKRHITESKDDWGKKTRTLTGESMAGFKGLGVQRAFWNAETGELVAVVWIGSSLSGWPGLAHGGAIATIFEDAMSRMVAGPNVSIDSIARPTSMSVTYAKPTNNTNFYVLRASFAKPNLPQLAPPPDPEPAPAKSWLPSWKDLTKKTQRAEAESSVVINATLEDLSGTLCVRAKGTFPVSG